MSQVESRSMNLMATNTPPTCVLRERIGEIESAMGDLRDGGLADQLPLIFELGRKYESVKALSHEIEELYGSYDSGISKEEIEALARSVVQLRSNLCAHLEPRFDQFFNDYHLQLATSKETMDKVFSVRHQVYCRELGYEPARADEKETDPYDDQSQHVLLTRKDAPDHGVGCIRTVFVDPTRDGTDRLPLEAVVTSFRSYNPAHAPRDRICELSRLSLLSDLRGSSTEGGHNPLRLLVTLALPLAGCVVGIRNKAALCYQLCRPSLVKYLNTSFGPTLMPIGAPVEFHGKRVPTVIKMTNAFENMDLISSVFYHCIEKQLYPNTTPESRSTNLAKL